MLVCKFKTRGRELVGVPPAATCNWRADGLRLGKLPRLPSLRSGETNIPNKQR